MLDKSVFDYSWINDIARDDKPVLIIAEGLLMYFQEQEVKGFMNTLVIYFPKAEMLFEMVTPAMVKASEQKGQTERFQMAATFQWGITSGKEIETYNTSIKFIAERNYLDYHEPRWNLIRLLALIPAYKNSYYNRIIHLEINQ